MDITVNVKDFMTKMEKDYAEYTEIYMKTAKLYQEKHEEYSKYLKTQIDKMTSGEELEKLRNSPSLPYWDGSKFKEVINALTAHTTETIIMSAHEYNDAKEAIRHSINSVSLANVAMFNDSY